MNVNEFLLQQTAGVLPAYGCDREAIERVLLDDVPFEERQQRALKFIRDVLSNHGKEDLLPYVAELAEVELGIRELQPGQRDHVVHVVRVYLLGIYLKHTVMQDVHVDALQWKVAGLTHDVGYPLEIAARIGLPFANKFNDIARRLHVQAPPVGFRGPQLIGIENLLVGNAFDIIEARLNDWGVAMNVRQVYEERTQHRTVCHGVISALSVLKVLDVLYAAQNPQRVHETTLVGKVDWDQTWFDTDNVSACAAIFLHNFDPIKVPTPRLNRHVAPVAYLLRLADTLQEWDRPSGRAPEGWSSDLFALEFDGANIIYRADIPDGAKEYLRGVLDATLEDHRIRIE